MMLKTIIPSLLPLLLLFAYGSNQPTNHSNQKGSEIESGTLEKMVATDGSAVLDVDMNRLNGINSRTSIKSFRFGAAPDSFFTIIVFNDELRTPLPSSLKLDAETPLTVAGLPKMSFNQLVVERTAWGEAYEFIVRDAKSGLTLFNVEGNQNEYDAKSHQLRIQSGRLLLSDEYANELGRPSEAGAVVGGISISATMRAIEVSQVVDGEVESSAMPAIGSSETKGIQPAAGSVPGPDVIVGDVYGLAQFDGSSGTQVGLAVATDSCNAGTVNLNWFRLPDNDHPVIPQNFYRMSGGAGNDERFEQIGQSHVKHAFTALTGNLCGFGCNGTGGNTLGSGCSDPYSASLNSGGSGRSLGSRAWINPFNGAFPRGDSATSPNTHAGHTHTGTSHRILVEMADLNTTLNSGASYYAEAQYITPHEYAWCQANPGQCNMYNNVSYRKYNVTGTGSPFSFSTGGSTTVREKPAIAAWTGATTVNIEPAPGADGVGIIGYKVTNPSPGVWHYEYAIYNQNLDRAIQSFSVPVAAGVTLSNVGFHAPPQHPGWANDGTVSGAGYSSAPWTQTQAAGAMTWSSETFAQNPNANAVRWGTLYNLRFDADRPPVSANATVGFFKTGSPVTAAVQGPSAPIVGESISARDGVTSEPTAGNGSLLFTVTLSAPAAAGGVSVNYATANDTVGANPATGGAACGGAVDYVNTNGTLIFAEGERFKTVAVIVCADTSSTETDETLLLNLSGATRGNIVDVQAVGTIRPPGTTTSARTGDLLITELRTSGPGGAGDDFVELYNNGSTPLTIGASDASSGYGVYKMGADCNASPTLVGTIPNGIIIPAGGHYLLVGSQYGLTTSAGGDATLTTDIESDRNVAIFSTAEVGNISSATRLDAVGFGTNTGGGVCDLMREGMNLPSASGSTSQYSFVRKVNLVSGVPVDTNNDAADFNVVTPTPSTPVSSSITAPLLGAPGPENLSSPTMRNSTLLATLLDPAQSAANPPNRVRIQCPTAPECNPATAQFGTMQIRRTYTNNTGAPVTQLRFRIIDITGFPRPDTLTADMRVLNAPQVTGIALTGGGTATVEATSLDSPAQMFGGGLNSTVSAGIINVGSPVPAGQSRSINFLLGVQQKGYFRFIVNVEAVP